MARILWLNWSGGGNLPPSLGIANALTGRGHDVAFAGRPEMVLRVERAGLRAIEVTRAYEQADRYPQDKWLPRAASYLTSPASAEEIAAIVRREAPDLLAIDVMFPVALVEAAGFAGPTVAVCHTAVNRMVATWQGMLSMLSGLRVEAGFGPLPTSLDDLWMSRDALVVTTLGALDPPQSEHRLARQERMHHVGPVLEAERHAVDATLPWAADDRTPLVLVSFSTMPEQGRVEKFERTIAALSKLPVHAVVTVGDSIDAGALKPAANVAIFATANHEALMARAAMVVTHGGHGTLMRALKHGLPMVVIPGLAADQPVNAAAAEAWGVGRGLPADASEQLIHDAVADVLANPRYGATARMLAGKFNGVDGAVAAADIFEVLLAA